MAAESFLRLLQFADGLFPAGGYAHSFGLETLVQSGRVQNAADVSAFLETHLESSAAPTDAVAVLCAAKYSLDGDLNALIHLDQLLDALKPAAETRDASRQMGRQTLRVLRELATIDLADCHSERSRRSDQDRSPERAEPTAAGQRRSDEESLLGSLGGRSFSSDISARREAPSARGEVSASLQASHQPLATSHFCSRFAAAVESGETPCHHPIVFGLAAALNGWEPRETASAFLYATSAMIAGASLRLLPLGQLAGQRVLAQAGSLIAALTETVVDKTEDDMWSFVPETEIAAMRHESLDGRLFRS